jgi:ubiquinone/menaquinone biosynthesis C-methylase UbiE
MSDPSTPKANELVDVFTRASGRFDQEEGIRRFGHFGRRLVGAAGLHPGAQVLDVATGRGAVLFPAADRVGPSGRVVGIDLAPGMIEATRQDLRRRGLANVEVRVMNAEQLDFPTDSFDALLCGFGVMFFPHLDQVLAEFRRVLKPGSIVAVSTWATPGPLYAWEEDLWRRYGIADQYPSKLHVQSLSEPPELASVLEGAGFREVEVRLEVDEVTHPDEAQWWARTLANAVTRTALESLGADALDRFRAEAYAHLGRLLGPDGIRQRVEALFGLGRTAVADHSAARRR